MRIFAIETKRGRRTRRAYVNCPSTSLTGLAVATGQPPSDGSRKETAVALSQISIFRVYKTTRDVCTLYRFQAHSDRASLQCPLHTRIPLLHCWCHVSGGSSCCNLGLNAEPMMSPAVISTLIQLCDHGFPRNLGILESGLSCRAGLGDRGN